MNVALFYLPDVRFGGWPTYTAHLWYGFKAAGLNPILYKISNKTEKNTRNWGRGIQYRNLSLLDAAEVVSQMPSIITATNRSLETETEVLLRAGAKIIIHDPTELKGAIPELLQKAEDVVTIRPINVKNLNDLGIQARYLPHPYMRNPGKKWKRNNWAASFSRIDWDKGTHHIIDANEKLPEDKQIRIYGAANTMYAFHKLPADWERHYAGQFPADNLWAGAQIASRFLWAVDMSSISGDGGGTQYTFLEAIDAGAGLCLNEKWVTGRDDDELAGKAVFCKAEELAEAIAEPPTIFAEDILANHNAAKIAVQTLMGE
jgi:hypothetical protein